ncbi:hypothetical protein BHU72_04400 [Desulfuribacillus stibiiarsenatis]|uniref:Uncharacterized protein n=1 Tax=Desulfuribacillus stibiiarsenatis TaxID=1390249 RepID=A0A1E5L5E6_9FIRM|nr:CBO0543 family protein [Desulfuribacillus stibiiarsenatis]OEH85340.1 hypothetical protein BHU72_04400 [Desulfuribacillus stibiiarsenatis]
MNGNKQDKLFLRATTVLTLLSLMILLFRKPPMKDWVIVYLFNAVTNGIIDNFMTSYKILKYPVRFFPNVFKTHVLFDFLIYPTFTVLYNQVTEKDKPLAIFYKLLYFTVPMFFIEYWAVKKTNLIKWEKGWEWYHTFISVTIKSLVTRFVIGIIRKVDQKTPMTDNLH